MILTCIDCSVPLKASESAKCFICANGGPIVTRTGKPLTPEEAEEIVRERLMEPTS